MEFLRTTRDLLLALSVAKTPRRLNLIHVTCCTISLYVVDFKRALDFGEAHPAAGPITGEKTIYQQ